MNDVSLYLNPFASALLISSFFILVFISISNIFGINGERKKKEKGVHLKGVSRFGGVAIILAFLIAILVDSNLVITQQIWGIIIASILILFVGVADDYFDLDWKIQFFFQVCMAVIVFIAGAQMEYVQGYLEWLLVFNINGSLILGVFLGIGWVVFLINAMNWLDGVDGLSGGVGLIAAISVFALSLKPEVNQPPIAVMMMSLSGALLGFLIFNFYPARIIAGTSGSFFMGFILAAVSMIAGTKIATTLIILSISVMDVFGVVYQRLKTGDSIFKGDKRHLHYRLLNAGWSHGMINMFFYGMTVLVAVVALNVGAQGKILAIGIIFALVMAITVFLNNKDKKNEKNNKYRKYSEA
ncbi:MraY family glycosyltransferase [Patescibacteria group bacterium]